MDLQKSSCSAELASAKLLDAAERFSELCYAQLLVNRPDDERRFGAVSLGDAYRAKDAVRLLLDPAPSFFGHKEAMFAGFAGWVIAPSQPSVRIELIGLRIKELLAKAEGIAQREFAARSPVVSDLIARHVVAGPQFIEQIYVPFGGMENLSEFGSRNVADHLFEDEQKSFYTLIKMMASCDYVATSTLAEGQIHPSVNKAVIAVRAFVDPKIMSRASIYTKWAECRETIAWVYAAESIDLETGTLLDALLSATANYEAHGHHFMQWASRTKYFCDHVLKRMPDTNLFVSNVSPVRKVVGEPFALTALSLRDIESVKATYGL